MSLKLQSPKLLDEELSTVFEIWEKCRFQRFKFETRTHQQKKKFETQAEQAVRNHLNGHAL
jgi:hypothetical protein